MAHDDRAAPRSSVRPLLEPSDWPDAAVVSASQFVPASLSYLYEMADAMRAVVEKCGGCNALQHRVLASVFLEPSTRTSSSFTAAMQRLGGSVVHVGASDSSAVKGETCADSCLTMASYADVLVLRQSQVGVATSVAAKVAIPFINAGDGVGEHPTQALLDVYTMLAEKGRVDGLRVTLVGDLKNGRTVHSLVRVLMHYRVHINYVCPEGLEMPAEIQRELTDNGTPQHQTRNLDDVAGETDVLYVTRVQKERFASLEEYERLKHAYIITAETLKRCKGDMIVMHPLPRVGEIAEDVDSDPRAAYFRQMRYGLFVRMALLALLLGKTRADITA